MTSVYREVSERLRGEVDDLERLVHRITTAWETVKNGSDVDGVYLDSVALNLHGFYSGMESLFRQIVRNVDGVLPEGGDWHKSLLEQVSSEQKDRRPAVVDETHRAKLDELRRFRHLVRNVYTFNLMPQRVEALVVGLPGLWCEIRPELLAFADFLSEVAARQEDGDQTGPQ